MSAPVQPDPGRVGQVRAPRAPVVLVAAVLCGLFVTMSLAVVAPRLWGWRSVTVTSGSMGPAVGTGDVVVTAPLSGPDGDRAGTARAGKLDLPPLGAIVRVDDPARPGHDLLHRVVEYTPDGDLVTRGDANDSADSVAVPRSAVRGVVRMRVPWLGWPAVLAERAGVAPLALVGVAAVVTLALGGLSLTGRRSRTRRGEAGWIVSGAVAGIFTLCAPVVLGSSAGAFTSTTNTGANTLAAAASFGYEYVVAASSPSFYYRMDDTPGALSMADFSANNVAGSYNQPTKGPTGRWLMDEGTGTTAADAAASINPLTQSTGTLAWAAGNSGQAISLDGSASTGSMASASSAVSTTQSFTIGAWVYPTGNSGTLAIAGQSGTSIAGFSLELSSNRFQFVRASNDASPPTSYYRAQGPVGPALNTWHFVAGVYDATAGSMTIYVDGNTGNSITSVPALWSATGSLLVGRSLYSGAPANPFAGRIDDVMTFRYAMSYSEMNNLTYGSLPGAIGLNQAGALVGVSASSTAGSFDGSSTARAGSYFAAPGAFTVELWFRTRTTTGGTIIGFNQNTGGDSATNADRTVYVDSGGKISFHVNGTTIRSAATYNDGAWHYLAASVGAAGMRLDVDATNVTNGSVTTGQSWGGWWVFGGGTIPAAAGNIPSTTFLRGVLDEVAYFPSQLSASTISTHRTANA